MNYVVREVVSYEVVDSNGLVLSSPMKTEDQAKEYAAYLFANHTLAAKLNKLAKDNGIVFLMPSRVSPSFNCYKEIVDGLYVTECDDNWCGEYAMNDIPGGRRNATDEQLYGKRGPDKFSDFTGYHNRLAQFSLKFPNQHFEMVKLNVILELDKIVEEVSDCQENLINTIYNSLYRGKP